MMDHPRRDPHDTDPLRTRPEGEDPRPAAPARTDPWLRAPRGPVWPLLLTLGACTGVGPTDKLHTGDSGEVIDSPIGTPPSGGSYCCPGTTVSPHETGGSYALPGTPPAGGSYNTTGTTVGGTPSEPSVGALGALPRPSSTRR